VVRAWNPLPPVLRESTRAQRGDIVPFIKSDMPVQAKRSAAWAASLAAVRAISASILAVATRVCSMFSVPDLLADRLVLPFASPRLWPR
jgi:hypothetical protein